MAAVYFQNNDVDDLQFLDLYSLKMSGVDVFNVHNTTMFNIVYKGAIEDYLFLVFTIYISIYLCINLYIISIFIYISYFIFMYLMYA